MRLHRVKVNGLAYLVFPNAVTSRFVHCVGTMHVAGKMITSILQKMDRNTYKNLFGDEKVEYVIGVVRLAAMLHDIGHGPFSHASENIMRKTLKKSENEEAMRLFSLTGNTLIPTHEYYSYKIINEDGEIDSILKESKGLQFNKKDISSVLFPRMEGATSWTKTVHPIVSGYVDSDRFDYLLRDSYMTGAVYGNIDIQRIIDGLSIKLVKPTNEYTISFHIKSLGSIEDMQDSRLKMYKWVYGHSLVVLVDKMGEEALKKLTDVGKLPSKFFNWKEFVKGKSYDDEAIGVFSKQDFSRKESQPFRGIIDRRYLPISLFKRPYDYDEFVKDISEKIGFGRDLSYKDTVEKEISRWGKSVEEQESNSIPRKANRSIDIHLILSFQPRSPYTPKAKEDNIWIYSGNEIKEIMTEGLSSYFQAINKEWTQFRPAYLGFLPLNAKGYRSEWKANYIKEIRESLVEEISSHAKS
jgi:HD superfamily phosphohydrolase